MGLATLTLTLSLTGIAPSAFHVPSATFVSTNPLCTQVIVLPQPAAGPRQATVQGSLQVLSPSKLRLSFPLSYEGQNFCRYRLSSLHVGLKKGLEGIEFVTDKNGVVAADELNLLKNKPGTFQVQCAHSTCRVLKGGSQVGYGSGNLAYLFLDAKRLNEGETVSELSLSF